MGIFQFSRSCTAIDSRETNHKNHAREWWIIGLSILWESCTLKRHSTDIWISYSLLDGGRHFGTSVTRSKAQTRSSWEKRSFKGGQPSRSSVRYSLTSHFGACVCLTLSSSTVTGYLPPRFFTEVISECFDSRCAPDLYTDRWLRIGVLRRYRTYFLNFQNGRLARYT